VVLKRGLLGLGNCVFAKANGDEPDWYFWESGEVGRSGRAVNLRIEE